MQLLPFSIFESRIQVVDSALFAAMLRRRSPCKQFLQSRCSEWFSDAQFEHPESDSGLNKADCGAILHIFVSALDHGNVRQYTILALLVLQSLVVLLRWVMDLGLL